MGHWKCNSVLSMPKHRESAHCQAFFPMASITGKSKQAKNEIVSLEEANSHLCSG